MGAVVGVELMRFADVIKGDWGDGRAKCRGEWRGIDGIEVWYREGNV